MNLIVNAKIHMKPETTYYFPMVDSTNHWKVVIDLETGIIKDWPIGRVASITFKTLRGDYYLTNESGVITHKHRIGVPDILCMKDSNIHGDWIGLLYIAKNGRIKKWNRFAKLDPNNMQDWQVIQNIKK